MSSKALSLVLAVVILAGAALVARHVHSTSNKPLPAGQSKPQPTTNANGDVNDKGDGGNKPGDGELQENHPPSVRGLIYPEVVDIATKLKNNIPDLLHFVSDAIRNEPYDGALRGSRGTLLAGAGDSADKAILLRDLLHIAGPQSQVRFASCSLTLEQATQLIASSQTPDGMAPATGLTKPTLAGGQAKKSAPSKIDKVAIEAMTSDWRDLGNTVRQNATSMQAKLSQQGVTVTNALLTQSQLIEAVRAHVWLQYREDSNWVDLDATIPGGAIGKQRCTPGSVVAELPEELYHHLSINVLLEERKSGQIATTSLLQTTWRTAELVGSNVTYAQAEPFNLAVPATQPPAAGMSRYTPILLLDDERRVGTPFSLPALKSNASKPTGQILGEQVGGILGSHRIGTAPSNVTVPKAETIGLWLQFVVAPPHGAPDIIERPIIDRIGYAARSANQRETAAAAPLEVAGDEYASMTGVWSVAIWTGEKTVPPSLDPKLREQTTRAMNGSLHATFENLGLVHRSYYQLRTSLFQLESKINTAPLLYAGPDLSLLQWKQKPIKQDNQFSIDLLSKNITPAPVSNSGIDPFIWAEAALESERLLLVDAPLAVKEVDKAARESSVDVANIFDRARKNDVPIILLRSSDENHVDTMAASDDARARIRYRLNEGRLLLIPTHAINISAQPVIGWWSIDPRNGFLIDEMENGSHQAGVESPMVTREESEKNTEAAREYVPKFKRGVCLLIRAVGFALAIHGAVVDMNAGNVDKLPDDIQDAADNLDGAEKECGEGEGPFPVGPVGADDPGTPLPRLSNASTNSVPPLKIPRFNGLPRGR